ncbi:hypothetical protein LTR22_005740 [Elasticomyces elasticus]|nr:hypothetical protein LTR22_005740 [Elasticomyces elasticus]KAK4925412.1 hypothetical protein LTR49_007476 [Elasticomyces elasticus]KAK5764507.1 hypothetical protein LTS12_005237 [Elasticomyces elasticus]
MHFTTVFAASALAATALAAPNAQGGRPWGYQPPRRPTTTSSKKAVSSTGDCGDAVTTTAVVTITEHDGQTSTSTKSSTASTSSGVSSGVIVDPVGGSTCSASTVTSTSIGIATLTITEAGQTTTFTEEPITITESVPAETETLTETAAIETITVTSVQGGANSTATSTITVTSVQGGANSTATTTVSEIATVTGSCPTSNGTAPFPTGTGSPVPEVPDQCVNEEDSEVIAEVFRQLIQDYSTTMALNALTEDFIDYSSAVNIIMNKGAQYPKNITGPTFASRATFMAGQGSQPKIPFERLNVFYGCDSVAVRWMTTRSGNGQKNESAMIPVIGNGIMSVVPAEANNPSGYRFRIKVLYSEFNAAAWLVNNGIYRPAGPVDYIVKTNTTTPVKRSMAEMYEHYEESLRGAAI